jgi:hypothetical protein
VSFGEPACRCERALRRLFLASMPVAVRPDGMYFRNGAFCGVKIRIRGGFAPEAKRGSAPVAMDPISHVGSCGRRRWYVYALALVWAVVGFSLYAIQVLRLLGGG